MRLFVAAQLPENILEALAETSALLRESVRGRYVAIDSLHVTLAFLGEVPSARIDDVIGALETSCTGFRAFDVSLGGFGSFGRRAQATLWQGFRDAGELPHLAQSVRTALDDAGFDFDEKPFRAHITLMRAADLRHGLLPSPTTRQGAIGAVSLFRSDLSGDRPIYEALHTIRLGA